MIDTNVYAILAKAAYIADDIHTTDINETELYLNDLFNNVLNIENPGWKVLQVNGQTYTSYKSGFDGVAFGLDTNNDGVYEEIVISYAGSQEVFQDWIINDGQIALDKIPSQSDDAILFYAMVAGEYENENTNISITGHSLGGALAQIVQSYFGKYTVTFNAPGMSEQIANVGHKNAINYVNMNDFIGCAFKSHIGETRYYLPDGLIGDEFAPHSQYYTQDYSKYITLPSDVTWSRGYSLAIWGYDVNNTNTALKAIFSPFVTKENLDKAVLIIEQYLGDKQLLETSFKFQIPNNYCYCIGSKYDDYLEGSNKNDKLWGNDGDDTLKGLDGNDTLYGVTGDDYLEGGKGNDDIRGSQGYDTYIFYTGDGNDVIKESKQIRPSVVTGVNFAQRRGEIHINNQVITGGTWDETTQTYIGYQEGVTYQWSGINNTQMIIKYGNGDTITIANFNNGDLNLNKIAA